MPRPSKKTVEDKAKAIPVPTPTMVPAPVVSGLHSAHPIHPAQPVHPAHPAPPVAVAPGVPQQRVVDNDSFLRVRDSAVGRLTTIVELLRSFTNDYIRQTNLLLGEHTAEGSHPDLINAFENAAAQLIMPMQDMAPMVEEKKERKKRTHDPNAPKRPLTPYFLYMQHARSIIANDLGTEAPKGAVQEEGQRRWAHMSPHEKQGWNNAYQYNLRLYNARVHSYKAGNPLAKNMSDEEALKYAEDYSIPMPSLKEATAAPADVPASDQDAIAEQLQHAVSAASDNEEETEEIETPAKTPKKGASTRKRKPATPAAEVETPKPAAATLAAAAAAASPDKKRRRTSTKAADVEKEEPKKSGRKKTKSS